jgi:hypothetical protein
MFDMSTGFAQRGDAESPPVARAIDSGLLSECLKACTACEQSCSTYADLCLGETQASHLMRPVRELLGCAEISALTAELLAQIERCDLKALSEQLELCAGTCDTSEVECLDQARTRQARINAFDARRRCGEYCRRLLRQLEATAREEGRPRREGPIRREMTPFVREATAGAVA